MKDLYHSYSKNSYPINWRAWKLQFFKKRNDEMTNKNKKI